MSTNVASVFLRRVLALDAIASGASGVLLLGGANLLKDLLGLPEALLIEAGVILVPYVICIAALAVRKSIGAGAVWLVIAANAVWVAGSVGLLMSGLVTPTLLGYGFVVAQAIAVGVFGELQYLAVRRASAIQA